MPEPDDDEPDTLDEYALDHTSLEHERQTRAVATPLAGSRGRAFAVALAGLAVLAVGGLGLLFLSLRTPATRVGAPATASPATRPSADAMAARPALAPLGPLPGLDESDEYARRVAAVLSAHPELTRWLGQTNLVRTLTAVVTNVADGESPRPHLAFLAPAQRFRVVGREGRAVADPAGFAGYDRFADAVASVDTGSAVFSYGVLEPLFDAAYRDLGHPDGGFRAALARAIAVLVATPVPPADAGLQPHAVGFRYSEPRFEQLTPAQKQFLRIGPRNVKAVQAKLRELQAALGGGNGAPSAHVLR